MAAPVDVSGLVERATGRRPLKVSPLAGAGNNVVARIDREDGPAVAKVYFSHPDDPRDGLGAAYGRLSFLWSTGVRDVPRPLEIHRAQNLGLYEFVEGTAPVAGSVTAEDADRLSELLGRLWDLRSRPGAEALPAASEAGFSLAAALAGLEGRLARLTEGTAGTPEAPPWIAWSLPVLAFVGALGGGGVRAMNRSARSAVP